MGTPDWLVVALAAVGAGLAGVLTATFGGAKGLIDAWFARRKRRIDQDAYARGLNRLAEFAGLLDQIKNLKLVDRVLLFVGQNGGGLPTPGKPYTVKAQQGWSSKAGVDVLKAYNFDLLVDHHYAAMLLQMVEQGKVVNTVAEMPEGAILKAFYRDEGVVQSVMYYLHCDGAQLVYLSLASYSGPFTPDQLVRMEMLVHRLRGVLQAP